MTPSARLQAALAAMALLAAPLAAQQSGTYTLSGGDIHLYNLIGTLTVEPSTGPASAVVALNGADAAKLTVRHDGGLLSIVYPGESFVYPAAGSGYSSELRVESDGTFDDDDDGSGRKVRVSSSGSGLAAWADIRVLLPEGARAHLHLGVGKATLRNVNGRIEVDTENGDIEANGTAGALSLDTGSGDIAVSAHKGGLSVDTGSGDVLLKTISTDVLSVDTGSGDIRVDGLTATRLSVDTGSGDILVTGASVRSIEADAGSGDISLGLLGDVDDLTADTGSGDVKVTAPKTLGALVDVESSSGEIESDFPIQVTRKEQDSLRGTLGDGQGSIRIDTGSGDVALRLQP